MAKPRTRNPDLTRSRILHAATTGFAAHGFHGTSADAIVAAARINKRMIYHYFGSKDGLYEAVLEAQWAHLREVFEVAIATHPPGSGGNTLLVALLEAYFEFVGAHPDFVRIVMWENLDGGTHLRRLWKARGPIFEGVRVLLAKAQARGAVSEQLDPLHLVISAIGAASVYFACAPLLRDVLGTDPLSADAIAQRKRQLVLLLERATAASS